MREVVTPAGRTAACNFGNLITRSPRRPYEWRLPVEKGSPTTSCAKGKAFAGGARLWSSFWTEGAAAVDPGGAAFDAAVASLEKAWAPPEAAAGKRKAPPRGAQKPNEEPPKGPPRPTTPAGLLAFVASEGAGVEGFPRGRSGGKSSDAERDALHVRCLAAAYACRRDEGNQSS